MRKELRKFRAGPTRIPFTPADTVVGEWSPSDRARHPQNGVVTVIHSHGGFVSYKTEDGSIGLCRSRMLTEV